MLSSQPYKGCRYLGFRDPRVDATQGKAYVGVSRGYRFICGINSCMGKDWAYGPINYYESVNHRFYFRVPPRGPNERSGFLTFLIQLHYGNHYAFPAPPQPKSLTLKPLKSPSPFVLQRPSVKKEKENHNDTPS